MARWTIRTENLILATALSFLVILVWFLLFPPPEEPATDAPGAGNRGATGGAPPVAATPPAADAAPSTPTARRPGRRARGAARGHRDRRARGLDLADRRSDRRPELRATARRWSPTRTSCTLLQPGRASDALLRALRLGSRAAGSPPTGARREHRMAAVAGGTLVGRQPRDAALGQRQGPDLPPRDRGRRELHVHRHRSGREPHRRRGRACSPTASSPATACRPTCRTSSSSTKASIRRADGELTETNYDDVDRARRGRPRRRARRGDRGRRRTAGSALPTTTG